MIGKNIRNLRHLFSSVGVNEKKNILFYRQRENNARKGLAYKIIDENKTEWCLIFNTSNHFSCYFDKEAKISEKQRQEVNNLQNTWGYFIALNNSLMEMNREMDMLRHSLGDEIVLLPEDFEKTYRAFCDNNKKMIKEIARYWDLNNAFCHYIYALCDASPNMMQWAVKNICNKYVHSSLIKNILYYFTNYPNLNGKCKKGTIVAYNGTNDIIKLHNELSMLRREKRVKSVVNSFNTAQKKILRDTKFTEREEGIINRFATLSLPKQRNFIRKMSTIDDVKEILKQMSLVSKFHFTWDKASFIEFLTNSDNEFKYEFIFDKDNVLVLKVKDYETIKHVAKTTNWCISKNKTYWNNYMKQRQRQPNFQYVLLDFNKKEDDETSIVGFTTQNDAKITHAHSFTNQNLMSSRGSGYEYQFTFKPLTSSIYSVLSSCNVPLDLFSKVPKLSYKWDLDVVLKMLEGKQNYQIIKNEDKKLVVLFNDASFVSFIGSDNYHKFINNLGENPACFPHLFYFDFNLPYDNIDKLMFCYIMKHHSEDYVTSLFNINGCKVNKSFETLCQENSISTDFLCRRNIWSDKLVRALESRDVNTFKSLLLDKNAKTEIELHFDSFQHSVISALRNSIYEDYAFDFLMAIYECGYTLTQLTDVMNIVMLVQEHLRYFCFRNLNWKEIPNESNFNKLIQGKYNNNNEKAMNYGRFFVLDMIMQHETDIAIVKEFAKSIETIQCDCLMKYFLNYILGFCNKISSIPLLNKIISTIIGNNDNESIEKLLNNQPSSLIVKILLSNLTPQHLYYDRIKAMSEEIAFT